MRSRAFNKRIEVWQIGGDPVADGYGGFTIADSKISDSWAKVETPNPGKKTNVTDYGITDAQNSVIFTLRKRNDLIYNEEIHFIKYRGVKYTISTAPANVNFEDSTIIFVGIAETNKAN